MLRRSGGRGLQRSGLIEANGVHLYHEVYGDGPPVLFISGASGDAGSFEAVRRRLATDHTVITYDRRANSRSPRPASWASTSTLEQAADAAALIPMLDLEPPMVFGTSSGAMIALAMAIEHATVVRGAILHEPPKISVLDDRADLLEALRSRLRRVVEQSGHRVAMADFVDWIAGAGGDGVDAALEERTLNNGEVWIELELGVVDAYFPTPAEISTITAPLMVMVGSTGATDFHRGALSRYQEALRAYSDSLRADFRIVPGAHTPYRSCPDEFAAVLRAAILSLRQAGSGDKLMYGRDHDARKPGQRTSRA